MQKLVLIASSILFFGNAISQTLTPGINLSSLDSSVSPRNDIYKFANGKWLSTQKIPASDGSWGSFNEINERNVANLKSLMMHDWFGFKRSNLLCT
jgi:predicted metalloendopeptidase